MAFFLLTPILTACVDSCYNQSVYISLVASYPEARPRHFKFLVVSFWTGGSKLQRKEYAAAAVDNSSEEFKSKILLCYGKEIKNRKGAGISVQQRGLFLLSCELAYEHYPFLVAFYFSKGFWRQIFRLHSCLWFCPTERSLPLHEKAGLPLAVFPCY